MSVSSSDDSSTSLSSDSTEPKRRSPVAVGGVQPPTYPKKDQAPQENLDEFWSKFTTKKPGKATRILPRKDYTPKKQKKRPDETPQLKPVSYDEAVAQCKAKVAQVVKECRRVNQRYRDPHFDIEIDFQLGRNQCLTSLQNKRHKIPLVRPSDSNGSDSNGVTLQSVQGAEARGHDEHPAGMDTHPARPSRLQPKPPRKVNFKPMAVHRVTEIFENPQFFIDGPSAKDVRQGRNVGDCWLMAALCTMSNKPGLIERICVAHDLEVGVYGFVFHRDGDWFSEIIDDKLYLTKADYDDGYIERILLDNDRIRQDSEEAYRRLYQTNSGALYFAQSSEPNETWVSLLEKAYAKAHGDYEAIEGGFTGEGIEDLTGGITQEIYASDILDKEHFWTESLLKVNKDFLFGCSTGIWGRGTGSRRGIVELHAYSVMKAVEMDGQRLLMLRNPWGRDDWKGKWSDGSAEWTPEWLAKLNHRFGDDGAFWISYQDLLRKFQSFDRTRLFGPEWRAAAIWTTFSVPWVHEYHDTKFAFSLSRPGPVVLTLSQLDKRYFKGLEGQYRFEFSFRVHVAGQEEYLVRSLTPYGMNRSVNVELELQAGDYMVLVMVNASRHTGKLAAEEVTKAYAKRQREKLARVALSYDLAHSRGRIVQTAEEKEACLAAKTRKEERAKLNLKKVIMDDRRLQHRIKVKRILIVAKDKAKAKEKRAKKRAKAEKKREEAEQQSGQQKGDEVKTGKENKDAQSKEVADNLSGTIIQTAAGSKDDEEMATIATDSPDMLTPTTSVSEGLSPVPTSAAGSHSEDVPGSQPPTEVQNIESNELDDSRGVAVEPVPASATPSKPFEDQAPKPVLSPIAEENKKSNKETEHLEIEELQVKNLAPPHLNTSPQQQGAVDTFVPHRQPPDLFTKGLAPKAYQATASQHQPPLWDNGSSMLPLSSYIHEKPARAFLPKQRATPFHRFPETDDSEQESSEVGSISSVSEISDDEVELELETIRRGWRQHPRVTPGATTTRLTPPPPSSLPVRPYRLGGRPPGPDIERDPWNAVVILGLRVYYRLAGGEDAETEVVKLHVKRPDAHRWDERVDDEEDGVSGAKAKTEERKVLDVDNSAKDAAKDIDIVDNGTDKSNTNSNIQNVQTGATETVQDDQTLEAEKIGAE